MEEKICCICGAKFSGYGNNPAPIKEKGVCCDNCNFSYVLLARFMGIRATKKSCKEEVR